ncbi:MAG: ATP-dependent protease ATPase subunit HslU [Thermoguttaceae bacterium]|jgi:ATP-dependent HslUV protease ATP-binding subunit HslU
MTELTPQEIVAELDRHIVGQRDAKRAIAVAIRNRWRRQRVDESIRDEINPKNVMMIGPTGVGKTEIARRIASLTGAPFVKVDATKYTEVGYHGNDVESMVRDLIENSIAMLREEERKKVADKAEKAAEERLVYALLAKYVKAKEELAEYADPSDELELETKDEPDSRSTMREASEIPQSATGAPEIDFDTSLKNVSALANDPSVPAWLREGAKTFESFMKNSAQSELSSKAKEMLSKSSIGERNSPQHLKTDCIVKQQILRRRITRALASGALEDESLEIDRSNRFSYFGDNFFALDPRDFMDELSRRRRSSNFERKTTVAEARKTFFDEEIEKLLDEDKIRERALKRAEEMGVIFIDEIDKIVGMETTQADVSRMGVQRDLLPIVEGTTIRTRYGLFSTTHVLFIAAGAFHRVKPSDLTPELQGRFPIRVELNDLGKEDFVRILTEPANALTRQYIELMKTENIELIFKDDAIDEIAEYAVQSNRTIQNIGARRLYTIMEHLLEDLSFEAASMSIGRVVVNAAYVHEKLDSVVKNEDLSKFIL